MGIGVTSLDYNSWNTYNGGYAITPCGYTNEFGNFSGIRGILLQSSGKILYANRYRGFENPFGDIWTNLEGVVIKRNTDKANCNVYATTDVLKYGDDYSYFDIVGVEANKNGWIKTFDFGSNAEIIPSDISASSVTYKCDYHWNVADSSEERTLMVGGDAKGESMSGLAAFASTYKVNDTNTNVGFRSLVRV